MNRASSRRTNPGHYGPRKRRHQIDQDKDWNERIVYQREVHGGWRVFSAHQQSSIVRGQRGSAESKLQDLRGGIGFFLRAGDKLALCLFAATY